MSKEKKRLEDIIPTERLDLCWKLYNYVKTFEDKSEEFIERIEERISEARKLVKRLEEILNDVLDSLEEIEWIRHDSAKEIRDATSWIHARLFLLQPDILRHVWKKFNQAKYVDASPGLVFIDDYEYRTVGNKPIHIAEKYLISALCYEAEKATGKPHYELICDYLKDKLDMFKNDSEAKYTAQRLAVEYMLFKQRGWVKNVWWHKHPIFDSAFEESCQEFQKKIKKPKQKTLKN